MSRYRIRAVAEMTAVSTATLRAWERRYGVPSPARTASAYRLYGDDDVALIARMRDLVESGVAPAEAARALREHAAGNTEVTADVDAYRVACDRIVERVMRFDAEGVRDEITRALTLGPATAIFDRTLSPALIKIGTLWHEGQITIAQEHLLSNLLLGRVNQLLALLQPTDSSRRVVLACFEDEDHAIGLYGAGLHFAAWGYRSVLLGARTPPDAIARVVAALPVDVVALSTSISPPTARARVLIDGYADACREVPLLIGGAGAESLRRFVEARGAIVASGGFSEIRKILDKAVRTERKPTPVNGTLGSTPIAEPDEHD